MSTWLGPPFMNSQMTDLALAGKCGGRGASGLARRGAGGRQEQPGILQQAGEREQAGAAAGATEHLTTIEQGGVIPHK